VLAVHISSLVCHSGLLGVQSRYCGLSYMQTEIEDIGQDPLFDRTVGQIQRVLSVLIEIEDYSQVLSLRGVS